MGEYKSRNLLDGSAVVIDNGRRLSERWRNCSASWRCSAESAVPTCGGEINISIGANYQKYIAQRCLFNGEM